MRALFELFPSAKFYSDNIFQIQKDEEIDYSGLQAKLTKFGYKRVTMVMDAGEFSVRGDILDVFTSAKSPVRIEFFGDTVEDIRLFEPQSQKSYAKLDSISIYPIYKFLLDAEGIKRFKDEAKDPEREEIYLELCEKLNETGYFEGIEYYQSYFDKGLHSILEHFRDYTLIFDETSQIKTKFQTLDEEFKKEFESKGVKLRLKHYNHLTYENFEQSISSFRQIGFDNFLAAEDAQYKREFETSPAPVFSGDMQKIAEYLKKKLAERYKVFICTNFQARVKEILNEYEIFSPKIELICSLSLGGGIIEDFKGESLVFLTDKELFNTRSKDVTVRKYAQNKETQDYIDSINDIYTGEYVVHSVHGIGQYCGLSKQEIDGGVKDYLEIQFSGKDKLYMPAEQVNLLFRFRGAGVSVPQLSKMGGAQWEQVKNKVKKEAEDVAQELLRLYAKREMAQGFVFEADTNWQYEMEEGFEYCETPDQMRAIVDVKKDMEAQKPMDRLVCADVGFGKTEVAIRAIFKAVMSGAQAVLIVPTTVLALQHYNTILGRFRPFSVNVELLSRFKSAKEQRHTVSRLKNGECDVVVGTHRLLQSDVEFKNLGLLVIDEEHRFGVRHKEKLKSLRENIDILSMSATPIPRTLNMALSGLKDMSVINTPPKNRMPVKTHVGEWSEKYIKNAINYEIERDGQVFYLYNRVETMSAFYQTLKSLVPHARIAIAHGQMPEGELERVMAEFANYEYDILLCTTIIESGLDISNANTIIIHDCDRFGLAQLYQLRGRVGRSDRQAFCYCFFKQSRIVSEEAQKRFNAIKDFTGLGSGYHIALRDIEIRGVGNLLGSKQHGHMANVGFDTYCALLEECVNELKAGKKESKAPPTIVDINTDAFIPDEWVGSTEQKILEYKRLSDVKTVQELDEIALSFKDRFSKLPESVENLVKLVRLRLLASQNRISSIRETPEQLRIYTPFSLKEWSIIKQGANKDVTKYFTFQNAPKSCVGVNGILLMNKNNLKFEEIFNLLEDLFYNVSKVVLEFEHKKGVDTT
ncbi:transcription-repair coupling factor [Candidatus Gastranaerophilus sp. (ex Termes propinquus)]|nr:transcription-repair coupling factor [Candidatus Gastranaerophilus sp. (ex Termes propinquus)]